MEFVGPIDAIYVNSFGPFSRWMEEPILELRALGEFFASILKDGDEIALPGSPEASGSRGSVETRSAPTLLTSSPYFNTILNSEPATQASTGEHANTESATTKRGEEPSAFADLLQAAGQVSDSNAKSPSPRYKPKRESPIDLEDVGSPSYSPPASPSLSFETLLERDKPFPNIPSSILSRPTPFYHPNPGFALPPPEVPRWKIDLNARKGHPIHTLHVGPRELAIISRCLQLVHKATLKGEECARVIIERQQLAIEMQGQYEQWEVFCRDLEDNVKIEKMERGIESEDEESESGEENDHSAWFGTSGSADHADARDYGRIGPSDGNETWGYRKFDAPPPSSHGRRLDTIDEDYDVDGDEEETDIEDGAALQARGTAGFGARARARARARSDSRHSMLARMDVSSSASYSSGDPNDDDDDDDDDGTATKTRNATFLDERTRGGSVHDDPHLGHGPDTQMPDLVYHAQGENAAREADAMEVDDGDGIREEDESEGKKGLKGSGGRMVGLYGEEI